MLIPRKNSLDKYRRFMNFAEKDIKAQTRTVDFYFKIG